MKVVTNIFLHPVVRDTSNNSICLCLPMGTRTYCTISYKSLLLSFGTLLANIVRVIVIRYNVYLQFPEIVKFVKTGVEKYKYLLEVCAPVNGATNTNRKYWNNRSNNLSERK